MSETNKEIVAGLVKESWDSYFKDGCVLPGIKSLLMAAIREPESVFKPVWKKFNRQLISLAKHESNRHGKHLFDNMTPVYEHDFIRIGMLLHHYNRKYGDIYDNEWLSKVLGYVNKYKIHVDYETEEIQQDLG